MSRVSLSANRRTKSKLAIIDPSVGGGAVALLSSMEGWWDASTYSGSGNWLNGGTGGSTLDFVITGAAFTTDHFDFNGTSDHMDVADSAPVGALVDIALADTIWMGIIFEQRATPVIFGQYFSKTTNPPGWHLTSDNTNIRPRFIITDSAVHSPNSSHPTSQSLNTKYLWCGVRRRSGLDLYCIEGRTSFSTPATDTTSTTMDNTGPLRLGGGNNGTNFQNMRLYAAFVVRSVVPSLAQLQTIADYYGCA